MPTTTDAARIEARALADQLERALRGGAWHGPAVLQTLAGLDVARADARPIPGAHTIREIVGHLAVWLAIPAGRLRGEADLGLDDADWRPTREATAEAWHEELDALTEAHTELRDALLSLDDTRLDEPVAGDDATARGLVLGVLQHLAYHGGQIALLGRATGATDRSEP